jgi:hypothetical protein
MDELEGQFEHEAWQVVVKNSMGMEAVEYLHQIGATTLKHLTQLDDEDFAALFDKKKAWKKTFIESVQQAWNAQDTAFSSPSDPSGTATPSSHLSTSGTASHFDRPFAVEKVQRNNGGERPPERPSSAKTFKRNLPMPARHFKVATCLQRLICSWTPIMGREAFVASNGEQSSVAPLGGLGYRLPLFGIESRETHL